MLIIVGCGTDRTWGGGWLRKCSDCEKDDCEDEGKCTWKKGKCVSKVKPPQATSTPSPQPHNSGYNILNIPTQPQLILT